MALLNMACRCHIFYTIIRYRVRSVASVLKMILNIIWSLGIAMIALFIGITIFLIINGGLPKWMSPHIGLDAIFVRIEFTEATIKNPKLLFISFLPFGVLMGTLGMAILYQLRKIFATLAAGNPFILENAKRMRKIGLLIFGGVFVELIAGNVIGNLIMNNLIVRGVSFSVKGDLNVGGIFFGLVMLILAEIFRQGALLKEEQDLTI